MNFIAYMSKSYSSIVPIDADTLSACVAKYSLEKRFPDYQNLIKAITTPPLPRVKNVLRACLYFFMIVHQKYINDEGVEKLAQKFRKGCYGGCPRVLCEKHPVMPVGFSTEPGQSRIRFYCPLCKETYTRSEKYSEKDEGYVVFNPQIDGAFFGPEVPRLLLALDPQYAPKQLPVPHVPKLYGYRIRNHASIIEKKLEKGEFSER